MIHHELSYVRTGDGLFTVFRNGTDTGVCIVLSENGYHWYVKRDKQRVEDGQRSLDDARGVVERLLRTG